MRGAELFPRSSLSPADPSSRAGLAALRQAGNPPRGHSMGYSGCRQRGAVVVGVINNPCTYLLPPNMENQNKTNSCRKFWNFTAFFPLLGMQTNRKHSSIKFIILGSFDVKPVIPLFSPYFLPSGKMKCIFFFCLPAGDITKPHQAGMCKSAKLPWFNMLFLLSNFSEAENALNFKEWRKSKRRSENVLHSRQPPSYFILWGETRERNMRQNMGEYFFSKCRAVFLLCDGFNIEIKGNG